MGGISFDCSPDHSNAILGHLHLVLESNFFVLTLRNNILNIPLDLISHLPKNLPIEFTTDIVVLIALAIGDSGDRIHVRIGHILQMLVELTDASVGDTLPDPSIPIHVVICVEFDAACLHGDYWVGCLALSWEYVEIVRICNVFLTLCATILLQVLLTHRFTRLHHNAA